MPVEKGQSTLELTQKQRVFVDYFCNKTSETYGNPAASYIAAGYKDGRGVPQAVSRLLSTVKIKREIDKYQQKAIVKSQKKEEITADYARQALLETYEQAKKLKDTTNQVACCRLLLQTTGQLSDKMVIDVQGAIRLEEKHQHAAKRIASIMVRERLLEAGEDDQDTQDVVDGSGNNSVIIDAESVNVADTETYGE